MGALESGLWGAGVSAFVPGGAAVAGLAGVVDMLGSSGEPALRIDFDPWGRGSLGYGVACTGARNIARLAVLGLDPNDVLGWQSTQSVYATQLSGLYSANTTTPQATANDVVSRIRGGIALAAGRAGSAFWLGDSAAIVDIGANKKVRVRFGESVHWWFGATPVHIPAIEAFAAELRSAQNALTVDSEPSFWWIDRRTWEGGGAAQTWAENVPLMGAVGQWGNAELGGTVYSNAYSLAQWTAGTTPAANWPGKHLKLSAAQAREEWEVRRADMLERYSAEREQWRAWKAQVSYQAELDEYLAQVQAQAIAAYNAGVSDPEQSAIDAGNAAIASMPSMPAGIAPTPIVDGSPTAIAAPAPPRSVAPLAAAGAVIGLLFLIR